MLFVEGVQRGASNVLLHSRRLTSVESQRHGDAIRARAGGGAESAFDQTLLGRRPVRLLDDVH
jgi:hypothetical protein